MKEKSVRIAELFEREKARFLGFVHRQMGGSAHLDAEDIVADVAFRLLRRADMVDGIENLTAYIYRSLANRIADALRGSAPIVYLDQMGPEQALAREPEHDGPDPDQLYQRVQLRERLREAIGQLAPRERAVWVATEIDGRSFRELAEAWGEPIGTILSRKSRANARLRGLLAEYENHL
jgi:RNA polymerase sigma factor (sigma-70 family)